MIFRARLLMLGLLAVTLASCRAPEAIAAPQLIRIGTTGQTGRITFTNVTRPDANRTVALESNPVIKGNNLYAPDFLRIDDRWYCYHGGWLTAGQVNDRIYLGISADLDPAGPWNPASQLIIDNGAYQHVHDPSVVIHDGTWYMVYTAFRMVGSDPRDWINYSTSTDGLTWTPAAGTAATEITLTDPDDIAGGIMTDMARPALVRTETRWEMWFDGRVDNGPIVSFLAYGEGELPDSFVLFHKYPAIGGFPGFFEPDVALRPDGSYLAVVQRHFRDLYMAVSTDGVNFTFTQDLSATHPLFPREKVSNPGLIYDQITDRFLGLGFGMTDSSALVDHDIGFSVAQYTIRVRSPGNVWHIFAEAEGLEDQSVLVFDFTSFDLVRIIDPVSGQVLFEQDFTDAQPGDLWHVQWEPGAPVVEPFEPDPDAVRAREEYARQLTLLTGEPPIAWSVVQGPPGAQVDGVGHLSGWTPVRADIGRTVTFQVRAENAAGSDAIGWQVEVLAAPPDFDGDGDVDQVDFGMFQRCLTGPMVPQPDPACEPALLDPDVDVDQQDLAIFLKCFSGANLPVNAACVD